MGGGVGLGSGGTSSNQTSDISKIKNNETTTVDYLPANSSSFGKINFNISDKNIIPVGDGGQPIGENENNDTKKTNLQKGKNWLFIILALLTLFFLLTKHKII